MHVSIQNQLSYNKWFQLGGGRVGVSLGQRYHTLFGTLLVLIGHLFLGLIGFAMPLKKVTLS